MQLAQLEAFCAVATSGSITAASRILNRVPSGVTIRIQQLESELECELFLRSKGRMTLSPKGRQLLGHAQQILDLSHSLKPLLHGEPGGQLKIGALDVAMPAFMPALVGQFRQRYPSIDLKLSCEVSERLVEQVMDGTLDIALTDDPGDHRALDSVYAFSDELLLVTEKHHPDVGSPADLVCEELYGFRTDCSFRLRMDRWLQEGGGSSRIIEMESYPVMLACVSAGMGAAWMPRSLLQMLPGHESVKVHSLSAIGRTDLYFIWQARQLTQNAERLLACRDRDITGK